MHLLASAQLVGVLAMSVVVIGCSDLTRVTDTAITQPDQYDNPSGSAARAAGAIGDFSNAFAAQVEVTGLLTDELSDASGIATNVVDRRDITVGNTTAYPWGLFSQSRLEALRAIASLRQYAPVPQSRMGELYALVGFTELFFAENMCNGIPLGTISGTSSPPTLGGIYSRQQLINLAIAHFDSSSARVTDSTGSPDSSIVSLAAVGRARALLDSGDINGALTAAENVPLSFSYAPPLDGVYQVNVVAANAVQGNIYLSDREGVNGLDYVSATDPRAPIAATGQATPQGQPGYMLSTQFTPGSPIIMASGVEAKLISAEAQLRSGNITGWSATLNALRSSAVTPPITPLPIDSTTSASAQEQVDVMFRERAFWLLLTGHRQGDLRRMVQQYGRSAQAVFPTGPYLGQGGGSYGTDVTFVPFGKQGTYQGCADRNP